MEHKLMNENDGNHCDIVKYQNEEWPLQAYNGFPSQPKYEEVSREPHTPEWHAQADYNTPSYQHTAPNPGIMVSLCQANLWKQFHKEGTEMILTKEGRRIFPGFRIQVSGLNPLSKYCIYLDAISLDGHRYKFQDGEWMIAGKGEPQPPSRLSFHPDSPALGSKWMKNTISFHKVKLSNSSSCRAKNALVLNSMHRYQLRIHIVECADISVAHLHPSHCTIFNETSFVTVTAYQNHEVTKLKIANNPYAKGFRKDGARGSKNKRMEDNCDYDPVSKKLHFSPTNDHIAYHTQNFANQEVFYPQHQHNYLSHNPHYQPVPDVTAYTPEDNLPSTIPYQQAATPVQPTYDSDLLAKIWDELENTPQLNVVQNTYGGIYNLNSPCVIPPPTLYADQTQDYNFHKTEVDLHSHYTNILPIQDEGYSSPTCTNSSEEFDWPAVTEILEGNESLAVPVEL